MTQLQLAEVAEITARTLGVSAAALALALLLGLPLGLWLGRRAFPGREILVSLVNTGMGAPPVVVGLAVVLLLWRGGPLGGLEWVYTLRGMVMAQVLISLPLIVGITLAAVAALDDDWEAQLITLGVPAYWRWWLLAREVRTGLLAAVIAGLGGILSEVGAAQMVGGNLAGETRVLTTSVMMYTQMGQFELALGLAAILLGLMLLLAAGLTVVQLGGQR